MMQLFVPVIPLKVYDWTCLSTDVDIRMGRVLSVITVSDSHRLAYQRVFGTVREIWFARWCKWSRQGVSGCLEGYPSSNERSDTRGPVGTMPSGQTRGSIYGWTCGIRPPQK